MSISYESPLGKPLSEPTRNLALINDLHVRKAILLIQENLTYAWQVEELALAVGLGPRRLQDIFKEEALPPPKNCLRQLRLEAAAVLLKTTFLSIKEVMTKVGFNSENYFYREFKRHYDMCPCAYREAYAQMGC